MASAKTPNTIEEQDAANNPGDAYYDRAFGRPSSSLAEAESNAATQNGQYVDTHGDTVNRNYNADEPQAAQNIDSTKQQEEAGSSLYNQSGAPSKTNFLSSLKNLKGKKALPGLGIFGIFIVGIGSTAMLSPLALFSSIEKSMTNDAADFTRTNIVMHRAYMGGLLGKGECTGSKLKCKITTATKEQVKKWTSEKFKIKGVVADKSGKIIPGDEKEIKPDELKDGERAKVASITFPNGTEAKNYTEFERETNKNIESRRLSLRVLQNKSSFFLNTKFNNVLAKFGLSKGTIAKKDSKQSEKDKAESRVKEATEKAKSKTGSAFGKIFKASGIISTPTLYACNAYNILRVSVAIVKAKWIADVVTFSLPFVQYASKIADGSVTESDFKDLEGRADQLVWYPSTQYTDKQIEAVNKNTDINDQEKQDQVRTLKAKENLNATDSQGLRMAMYGDTTKLKEFTQAYTTGGIGAVTAVSKGISEVQQFLGGKQNIREICINASRAAMGSSGVQVGLCIGAAITIVGGALCIAKFAAVAAAFMLASDAIIQHVIIPALTKAMQSADLPSDLRGVDAGNALAAGIGLMLAHGSLGYGLKPAKSPESVKKFITSTNEDYHTYKIALEKDDAQKDPFNAMNQYSFAHQLVTTLNPYIASQKTGFSTMANLFSVATNSLTPRASALYSQPSLMTSSDKNLNHRLDSCTDTDKQDIEIVCDWSGRIVGVSSDRVLGWARQMAAGDPQPLYDTIDFMQQEGKFKNVGDLSEADGGTYDETCNDGNNFIADALMGECKDSKKASIDEEGKTVDASEYSKYIQYCTEKREYDIGGSDEPIEAGSDRQQDWSTGKQCAKDSMMMDRFAFYFNFCEAQYATANATDTCYGNDATTTASPSTDSTCGDGSNASIYTCATQYDNYRYLWGGGHSGTAEDFMTKFKSGGFKEWEQILDCSGLVRMATFEATGVDTNLTAPSGFRNNPHWEKIPAESAQQGDIVTLGSNDGEGHVVIVRSNDTGKRMWDIFHASTADGAKEDNIGHGSLSYDGDGRPIDGVYRLKK